LVIFSLLKKNMERFNVTLFAREFAKIRVKTEGKKKPEIDI